MGGKIVHDGAVAVIKQSLKRSPDRTSPEEFTQAAEGHCVIDTILQIATPRACRFDTMGMLPAGERPGHLDVPELHTRLTISMLGKPPNRQGAQACFERDPGAIFDTACALDHFRRQPWRRQTFEGPRPCMPGEDLVGGGIDVRALNESLSLHKIPRA
jgi:hypothetical protein